MARAVAIIAGGGTGGHIYPGLAIARELEKQGYEIHFVGTSTGLEIKIIPREKLPLHLISVGKLNFGGGSLSKIKTLIFIPLAFLQSVFLLLRLRPQIVLGVGGYASGPFVLMASWLGFNTNIWEPNVFPGLTNRWLSKFVRKCFVVFPEAQNHLKTKDIKLVGMPLREVIEKQAMEDLSTQMAKGMESFTVLVFGGSQGSHFINKTVLTAVTNSKWPQGVKLIHQTGPHDIGQISKSYEGKTDLQALEYIYEMEKYYQMADVVVCRSGASTLAELSAMGKASILIPLPTAADDHQRKNAESLERNGAAKVILQSECTPERLVREILFIKNNPDVRSSMQTKVLQFYVPQAAHKIATLLTGH